MCSPAIAAWSEGLSRATHVQIAPWVTALLRLCAIILSRVSRCVSWRPQRCGCRSKFKAFWTRCVPCAAELCDGSAAPGFLRYFFLLPLFRGVRTPRTRSTTPRPESKSPRTTPKRPAPGAKTPQMTPARTVGDDGNPTPPPGLPPVLKKETHKNNLRTSAPRPRANRRTQKRQNASL